MTPRGDVLAGAASSKGRHLSSVRDSLDVTARSGDSGSEPGLPRGFVVAVSCAPTILMQFAALATGKSGDIEIEQAFLAQLAAMYETFCKKQRDYGRGNIAKFGADGVMVRVSDKVERLVNLSKLARGTVGHAPVNESLNDTWLDIATYGVIGMMCRAGEWPGVERSK